eukprot:GILK01013924.1.p1 GENE.GILK01013924.1~~GILK01013924.1.p1  ORF type:complete len:355 (-),score=31.71 GILK01013924.1:157-1137(-)
MAAYMQDGGMLFSRLVHADKDQRSNMISHKSSTTRFENIKSGSAVVTPYGYGTVLRFRESTKTFEVKLAWGTVAFLNDHSVHERDWIQIKLLTGNRPALRFKIGINDTLYQIKSIIHEMRDIPIDQQTLVSQLRELKDDNLTLRQLKVPLPWSLLLVVSQTGFHWNPRKCGSHLVLCDKNMTVTKSSASDFETALGDKPLTRGRIYWEVRINKGSQIKIGVSREGVDLGKAFCDSIHGWGYYGEAGQLRHKSNSEGKVYGGRYGTNDVIGVLLDMEAGTLSFYKNRDALGVAFEDPELRKGPLFAAVACLNANDCYTLLSPARIPS